MKLTRSQRKAIFAGERPPLAWARADECPFSAGDVEVLMTRRGLDSSMPEKGKVDLEHPPPDLVESPLVWITIKALRRSKRGGIVVDYIVRDDRPHLLDAMNGYTTARHRSPDPDMEGIDDADHDRLHRESKVASSMRRELQRTQEEKLRLETKLNEARYRDKPGRVKVLQTRIGRVSRRLDRAA